MKYPISLRKGTRLKLVNPDSDKTRELIKESNVFCTLLDNCEKTDYGRVAIFVKFDKKFFDGDSAEGRCENGYGRRTMLYCYEVLRSKKFPEDFEI